MTSHDSNELEPQAYLIECINGSTEEKFGIIVGLLALSPVRTRELNSNPHDCWVEERDYWNITALPSGRSLCAMRTWRAAFELAVELGPYGDLSKIAHSSPEWKSVGSLCLSYGAWDQALAAHLPHYPPNLPQMEITLLKRFT